MCLKPIKILNRSRRFRDGLDKPVLTVPCGHCEQCQARKADDWFVRAVAEYQRVIKTGGFVWFPTLTYRNSDLPVWYDKEFGFQAPVFDKNHFVSFRNKLRVYLSRAGYDFKGDNTIRYLYVTEYGDKKGRSHIHCLLFVPLYVPFGLFKTLVRKAWIYGLVRYSPLGDTIQSTKGLKYTMKYMHKDMLWFDKYKVDDYLNYLNDMSKDKDIKKASFFKAKLRLFKKCLPHHCQSMGFGSSLSLSDHEFIDDSISSSKLGIYDVQFNYHVPMYYKRKFLYDFDKVENIYTINPRGLHIKYMRFDSLINKLDRYYSSVIYSSIVDDSIKAFFVDLDKLPFYDSFKLLSKFDSRDLAYFALCYRGLSISNAWFDYFNSSDTVEFLKLMKENAYDMYCSNLDNRDVPLFDSYLNNGAKESVNHLSFNNCNIYQIFDQGLQYLELFEHRLGDLKNNALIKEYYNQSVQFGKLFHLV